MLSKFAGVDRHQIINLFVVDFKIRKSNLKLSSISDEALVLLTHRIEFLDSVEQVLHSKNKHPAVLVGIINVSLVLDESNGAVLIFYAGSPLSTDHFVVDEAMRTHHGVGLARARLAVNEHGAVESVKGRQHDLSHGLLIDIAITVLLAMN